MRAFSNPLAHYRDLLRRKNWPFLRHQGLFSGIGRSYVEQITRFRVAGHALADIASIAILAVSLMLGSWVVLVDPATATADEQDLVELINTIVRISVALTLVLTAVNAALEVRRFVRMRRVDPEA